MDISKLRLGSRFSRVRTGRDTAAHSAWAGLEACFCGRPARARGDRGGAGRVRHRATAGLSDWPSRRRRRPSKLSRPGLDASKRSVLSLRCDFRVCGAVSESVSHFPSLFCGFRVCIAVSARGQMKRGEGRDALRERRRRVSAPSPSRDGARRGGACHVACERRSAENFTPRMAGWPSLCL